MTKAKSLISWFPGLSITGLFIYMLLLRLGYRPSEVFFWITVFASIIGIFLFCLFGVEEKRKNTLLVLFYILIFVWLLKSLYVPRNNVLFFGSDSYYTLNAIKSILSEGWFANPPWSEHINVKLAHQWNYPFLPEISIGLVTLSSSALEIWARWGMVSLSLTSLLLVYGISFEVYGKLNVASLATIAFGLTYYFVMFHSQFHYEAFSFTLFLGIVFSVIKAEKSGKFFWTFIGILLSSALIFSHHLTALMLFLFLLLFNLIGGFFNVSSFGKSKNSSSRWTFLIFFAVLLLTYWIYLRYTPIKVGANLLEDAFRETGTEGSSGLSIPLTLRYLSTLFFQAGSSFAFGILAFLSTIKSKSTGVERQCKLAFLIWGGFLGVTSLLGLFGIFGKLNSFPSRMEVFGYVLLLPAAISSLNSFSNRKFIAVILGVVILSHGAATLLRIAPYLYSERYPDLSLGEVRAQLLRQEYEPLMKLQPDATGIIGYSYRRFDLAKNLQTSYIEYNNNIKNLEKGSFDYYIVGEIDHFHPLNSPQVMEQNAKLSKIYDAGRTEIFIPNLTETWNIESILNTSKNIGVETGSRETINWLGLVVFFYLFVVSGYIIVFVFSRAYIRDRGLEFSVGSIGTGMVVGMLLLFLGAIVFDINKNNTKYLILFTLIIALTASTLSFLMKTNDKRKAIKELGMSFLNPLILLSSGLLVLSFLFQVIGTPNKTEPYTEFYVTSFKNSSPEDTSTLSVMLQSHEAEIHEFKILGWLEDQKVAESETIQIQPGKSIETTFPLKSFTCSKSKYVFQLQDISGSRSNEDRTLSLIIPCSFSGVKK